MYKLTQSNDKNIYNISGKERNMVPRRAFADDIDIDHLYVVYALLNRRPMRFLTRSKYGQRK
jgi:hypothetical protein